VSATMYTKAEEEEGLDEKNHKRERKRDKKTSDEVPQRRIDPATPMVDAWSGGQVRHTSMYPLSGRPMRHATSSLEWVVLELIHTPRQVGARAIDAIWDEVNA
jgi:hypothetical protein